MSRRDGRECPCLQSATYTHDVVLGFFIVMCGLYNCERWRHQFGCKIQRLATGSSQIITILLLVEIDTWGNVIQKTIINIGSHHQRAATTVTTVKIEV